jgi:hypothetical protein
MINKILNLFKPKSKTKIIDDGSFIVHNAISCKFCHDYLESNHKHDFKDCSCGEVAIDGGLSYLKRTGTNYIERSINSNAEFEVVRAYFKRGTYGKNGDEELKFIALKDMEDSHIEAILKKNLCSEKHRTLFEKEKFYRSYVTYPIIRFKDL